MMAITVLTDEEQNVIFFSGLPSWSVALTRKEEQWLEREATDGIATS